MKAQRLQLPQSLEEQLTAMDANTLKASFTSMICARLTNAETGPDLADFLTACIYASDHDLGLTDLCTAVNALQVIKDMVLSTQLTHASPDTVRHLVQVLIHSVQMEKTEAILRMLGSVMFWPQAHVIGLDEELVTVCKEFMETASSYKMCQLALECMGNMLRRSNTALNSAKEVIYPFVQKYTETQTLEQHLKIHAAAIRALHYILPQDHPSDFQASALFFSLRKLLYLGTPFAPEHLRVINDSDSSSSETSDSEALGRNKYVEKIKCYGLICIKSLFQTNGTELFKNWPYLFPDQQRGSTLERMLKTPSLLYLLFHEKSTKVRVTAAAAVAGILEHSPLSAWKGKHDTPRSGPSFIPFSSELGQIITNLHEAVAELLRREDNQQFISVLLKLAEVILANAPYQSSVKVELVQVVCEAGLKWLSVGDVGLRQGVLAMLCQGFMVRPGELEGLLKSDVLKATLFPMSLSEDLIAERLMLLSKVGVSLPQTLLSNMTWVKSTLPLFTTSPDTKVSSMGFTVISEHMKLNPDSPLSEWVLGQWFNQLSSDSLEVLGQCFTALAAFPSLSMMNTQQKNILENVISQFLHKNIPQAAIKVSLLRLIAKIIPDSGSDFFNILYDIVGMYKSDTSLAVALSVSECLIAFSSNSLSKTRISDLSEWLMEKSRNKNEKIVSGAIIGIGKLMSTLEMRELEGCIEGLVQSVMKALEHKNAKVGWDACEALGAFVKSKECRVVCIHSTLLPTLLTHIEHHHNYKTRISCCQLLTFFHPEITLSLIPILIKLLDILESDYSQEPANFAQSKHQHAFRVTVACSITTCAELLTPEIENLQGFLTMRSHAIFEAIKTVAVDLTRNKDLADREMMVRKAAKKVHTLIEADPEIHASFGVVEGLEHLSRLGRENLQWLLGYSEAPEDIDISLRYDRTPTSPSHRAS